MPDERFSLGERNPLRQGLSVKELLRSTTCYHYITDYPLKLKIKVSGPPPKMANKQELQVKFIPGEHCFLENIQIQLREIKVGFKVLRSVAIRFLLFRERSV